MNTIYEEIKDDIEPFLRLYRLSKAKGMGAHDMSLTFLKLQILTYQIFNAVMRDLREK